MCRPRWAFVLQYGQNRCRGRSRVEWNLTGEYLCWCGMAVRQYFTRGESFAMYLDRDHRERENIRFLAVCSPFIQDLWRSPSSEVGGITQVHSSQ